MGWEIGFNWAIPFNPVVVTMPDSRNPRPIRRIPLVRNEGNDPSAVQAYLAVLDPTHRAVIDDLRRVIREADSEVTEGIKWNVVSFYRRGWFASVHFRPEAPLQLILHHGIRIRVDPGAGRPVSDPEGLLTWVAPDRAVVSIENPASLTRSHPALAAVVRQWIGWHLSLGAVGPSA